MTEIPHHIHCYADCNERQCCEGKLGNSLSYTVSADLLRRAIAALSVAPLYLKA
jgi:hypothetical protein